MRKLRITLWVLLLIGASCVGFNCAITGSPSGMMGGSDGSKTGTTGSSAMSHPEMMNGSMGACNDVGHDNMSHSSGDNNNCH